MSYSGTAGWTCAQCGRFVAAGDYHVCITGEPARPKESGWTDYLSPALNRIADAMQRIAAALEKLAEGEDRNADS